MSDPQEIPVTQLPIRLGQFLKLADLVQDGGEARIRIQEGEVQVNGIVEKRRGRQLAAQDTVTIAGQTLRITAAGGDRTPEK